MHFLFVAKQKKVVEAFIGTVRCLVERGHTVTLAVQEQDEQRRERWEASVTSSRFSVVACPEVRSDEWADVASLLRRLRDCVHYLRPPLRGAVKLRARVLDRLRQDIHFDAALPDLTGGLLTIPPDQVQRIESILSLAEQHLPSDPVFDALLASHRPDVLLLSPVVHFGHAQTDLVASARRLKIPAWMLLYSWDNLSTKGTLHRWPDLMFVWNEQQRREAESLHGFPGDRVIVVGAPRFDEFFALRQAMTRDDFLRPLGLDPAKLTLLYVCSSRFVSESEMRFVERWITAVRQSVFEPLRTCNIVVRPHPDIALLPPGTVMSRQRWPAFPDLLGRLVRPFDDPQAVVLMTANDTPRGLHESICHSDGVVGLNTTAELEAGIVGRPVFTILADERDADGQSTTVHFHYLRKEHGGFVATAASLDEHLQQLEAEFSRPADRAPIHTFITSFVRPHGIDTPVSPLYADALERAAQVPSEVGAESAIDAEAAVAELDTEPARQPNRAVLPLGDKTTGLQVYLSPIASRRAFAGVVTLDDGILRWIDEHLAFGDVLYDVGAGIGEYAIVAAKRKAAIVIGFEPAYAAHKELCDNLLLNRCEALVVPVPLALGARDALAEIKYPHGQPGEPGYVVVDERSWRVRHRGPNKPYLQPACLVRLDSFVSRQQAPAPQHIHIGAGINCAGVCEGAPQTLRLPSMKTVYVSADTETLGAVTTAMLSAGLVLSSRVDHGGAIQLLFTKAAVYTSSV
jgi:FkbM family methyltransferase